LTVAVGLLWATTASGATKVSATTSCGASSVSGSQQASIDTSTGCNDPNGTGAYPVTGWVYYRTGAGASVQLFDGLEGLSTHKFYSGTYVFCLYPTDGTVSHACSTLNVTAGTGSYPSTPPTMTGTLPVITGGADGNFIAGYSLTVQTPPTGHLNSFKGDFWVLTGNAPLQGGHWATQSVKPFTIDSTPPSCSLTMTSAGPPKEIFVTVQDLGTGIETIITGKNNAVVAVPTFSPGTMSPLVITATKQVQSAGATLEVTVTDAAGNQTVCDPKLPAKVGGNWLGATIPHLLRPRLALGLPR
jgi:hypothetical protein